MEEKNKRQVTKKQVSGWKVINNRPSFTDKERKEEYKKILVNINKNLFDN